MPDSEGFRQLLIADVALGRGVASARDVAYALLGYWEQRGEEGVSVVAELLKIADVDEVALNEVVGRVDQLIAEASGDAHLALTQHGGLDRTICAAMGETARGLTSELANQGVPARAPLRPVAERRYVDFEVAGEGGMGLVYMAVDTELNRLVAFKMVRPDAGEAPLAESPQSPVHVKPPSGDTPASRAFETLKTRFLQEATITGGLEHPGIVPVYEIGQTPTGIPYYTMRFVRGRQTLEDAIDEVRAGPFENRIPLLEQFLKIADAIAYAHSRGVIHRDVKPRNVALGCFGEVVLLDWGLAKYKDRPDLAASRWQQHVQLLRDETGLKTLMGMGTPGYMAPEAARGELESVDEQSDVYSLGSILYEILTGHLPHDFTNVGEFAATIGVPAPPARAVDPDVPEALSELCAAATAIDKHERSRSIADLTAALRAWQAKSALDQEVENLLRDAGGALAAAEQSRGELRLRQVDRAAAALEQVQAIRPDSRRARRLKEAAGACREQAIRERAKASTQRLLVRGGGVVLAVAALVAFLVAGAFDKKAREAEEARDAARAERDLKAGALESADRERAAKSVALEEKARALDAAERERDAKTEALVDAERERDKVLRLSDAKLVGDLVMQAESLWPIRSRLAPATAAWLRRARQVVGNREDHEAALAEVRGRALPYTDADRDRDHAEAIRRLAVIEARLRVGDPKRGAGLREVGGLLAEQKQLEAAIKERSWHFDADEDAWRHQVLTDLLRGLGTLESGLVRGVEARHKAVWTLRRHAIEDEVAWNETTEGIRVSERYGGLELGPQEGLVPLGPDPDSQLFEFAHLGSGSIPIRDVETGRLVYEEDAAIVLVLIPGGTDILGSQKTVPGGPNYDPDGQWPDQFFYQATLSPFFVGKHEVTQAQWATLTGGLRPSRYAAGNYAISQAVTNRNPVEHVSWADCKRWLARYQLDLPTDAQWEYACRASTDTAWHIGSDASRLGEVANIADVYLKTHSQGGNFVVTPEVDDGHGLHAPVGSYAPNDFGLHDMHGNVWEWCRDLYLTRRGHTTGPLREVTDPLNERGSGPRVYRGGSWSLGASYARSASRERAIEGVQGSDLGVRAAIAISTD